MILHDDGELRLGATRNLLVAVWREAPTVEQLRVVERAIVALAKERGESVGYVNAILAGGNRFPPEVREEVTRIARAPLPYVGVAHLVKLPGWKGPAARAFVRAAITIANAPAPNRVFRDERACAAWMCDRLGGGWTIDEAARAYHEVQR